MRNLLQHIFNPLHIYCRLRQFGLGGPVATRFCSAYERWVYSRIGRSVVET